jgi:5-methylcytosine-specific restriction endonuclease McrBC GTP-binding regulatory subunit McrB
MSLSQNLEVFKVFDSATVKDIVEVVSSIEPARWMTRKEMAKRRAINGEGCHYDFCGHSQMSLDQKSKLKNLAPKFEGFPLAEVAINRYNVGDYIGKHKDNDFYRLNLVIALQQLGDGVLNEDSGEFIEDVEGQGVLFRGIGPIHSVPPAKNLRHCLIYLYE